MTSLQKTIENFHAYILKKDKAIEKSIAGPSKAFKKTRLDVYKDGYFLRLLDILSRDFVTIQKLVGKKKFSQLCKQYLANFPSTYFTVRYVGQNFEQFLKDQLPENPILAEMAAFEWALENTIDTKDAPQITFEEVSVISPEKWPELTLEVHPSVETVTFFYAVPALWQYLSQSKKSKITKPSLERQSKPVHWLIWRFKQQSYFRQLDEQQLWMIRAIQKGSNFSDICSGLCEYLEEEKVIPFIAETLRTWITEGVFSKFST